MIGTSASTANRIPSGRRMELGSTIGVWAVAFIRWPAEGAMTEG